MTGHAEFDAERQAAAARRAILRRPPLTPHEEAAWALRYASLLEAMGEVAELDAGDRRFLSWVAYYEELARHGVSLFAKIRRGPYPAIVAGEG